MRKPKICICKNKDADKLCSNCTADQHLCFHHRYSTIPLLLASSFMLRLYSFSDFFQHFVNGTSTDSIGKNSLILPSIGKTSDSSVKMIKPS